MSIPTPGPWVVQTPVTGRGREAGCAVIASDEEVRISNPSRGIVAFVSRRPGMSNAETLANARLIAAAPEMLAALEMFGNQDGTLVEQEKAEAAIMAAIAKVRCW
jgi:hypothetical protein